jgi:hypothetical protein
METTHRQRRQAVIKKGLADSTKVKDAKHKAYQVAHGLGVNKSEVDRRFAAEVERRFYGKTGESLDPVILYSEIAKALTAR